MLYLILGFTLLTIFLMIVSKNILFKFYKEINLKIKKRMDSMLKLIRIAPVIVLLIILILTLTYFKTKLNIRLSHAFLVLNFWIFAMVFYYIIAEIVRIRKLVILLPASGMAISMFVAIYLTPLYHYENVFKNTNLIIPNFFGLIMMITFYYINYRILGKETKK